MDRGQFRNLKKGMVVRIKTKEQLLKEGWESICRNYGTGYVNELILQNNSFFEYSIIEPMLDSLGQKVRVAEDPEDMGDGVVDVWLEDFDGNRLHGSWTPGMIECCIDMIEAPGISMGSHSHDMGYMGNVNDKLFTTNTVSFNPEPEEKVGLTVELTGSKQDWMAGFIAGYQMALEHMKGGK